MLLAERGAKVVINDNSPERTALAVAAAINDRGGEAVPDTSSVATPEGGAAVVETALDAFGRLDIVVNNAGILTRAPFADLTPEMVRTMLAVSIEGAINVTRPAWRHMAEQGYGRVVMTSSNAGWIGALNCAHYGAGKLGMLGLTHCLALEAAELHPGKDIRVNALAPRAASPAWTVPPPGPPGTRAVPDLSPARISPVVAWLVHESCQVNGELFAASGGRVARVFLGLSPGWFSVDLTPEEIRDHLGEICAEPGYAVPRTVADEVAHMTRVIV
jgi:NAD(P)-dependent dehydrogenase (short-subunit alcohol dehydrogenase family)